MIQSQRGYKNAIRPHGVKSVDQITIVRDKWTI